MSLRAIILDFDGTLVESVGIKDQAFATLFKDYPAELPAIMDYHMAHNAVLRFEKFRHITREILGLPYTAADKARLSADFHDLVFTGLSTCPEVDGALDFLDFFHGRTPLYLVSKSPDDEFAEVLRARGLAHYFDHVYAGSWDKTDALVQILKRHQANPDQAVFIGDTPEDAAAAVAAGVPFIGRQSTRDLTGIGAPTFADMGGILNHLREKTN